MTEESTIECPICKEPYIVHMFYSGDQSACPDCRRKAREKEDLHQRKNGKYKTYIQK